MAKRSKTRPLTRGNSKALIVVAHPDDETLFMAGPLIQKTAHTSKLKRGEKSCRDWTVVCATDANGNGEGVHRMELFREACRKLGAKMVCLNLPDQFEKSLDHEFLVKALQNLGGGWTAVYTHGPLGEYGHAHHQSVCLATHEAFEGKCPVWSAGSNVAADLVVLLDAKEFRKKTDVLMTSYYDEIRKFLNLIPVRTQEAFNLLSVKQVRAVQAAARGEVVDPKSMGPYAWLYPLLKEGHWADVASKFFKIYFSAPEK